MELAQKERFLALKQKAAFQLKEKHLTDVRAQVALVLDISKSMYPLFREGVIQTVIERMLALAVNLDDDGRIDIFVFGTEAAELPSVTIEELEGYARREIMARHKINGATRYATALELVRKRYDRTKGPALVLFMTDGNNSDKKPTEALLRELSFYPVFVQFIGIGKEKFSFLEKLDQLDGRFVDNAGFMHVNDIAAIPDTELYGRLLGEFPVWLQEVRKRKMVREA